VVSAGGVELVELEELDVLELDVLELDVLLAGRVVELVEVAEVALGLPVAVGTAVGPLVAVEVGALGNAVGATAATALAVLQVSSGRVAGSAELTRLAAGIHAGAVSRSGWRMTSHDGPLRPMTQTRSPRCRVATAGPRVVSSLQP
jgi:hypothetical protein